VLKIQRREGETCATPLKYIPSYEIFNNIFGDSIKIKGVLNGVDQRVHLQHEKANVLNVDEKTILNIPLNKDPTCTLNTPWTKALSF
jgi:hypothetical protein